MNPPATRAGPPPAERFPHIDALRGVAVLMVVLVHVGYYAAEGLWFTQVSRFGQYGVQLFFMLSAFTLCHSISRQDRLGAGDYSAFLTKRFFRIAPMYYGAAIFYTFYSVASFRLFGKTPWTEPAEYSAGAFLSNATFTHALWPGWINSVVPGGWSIACEFLFYLVFPFLFFACRRRLLPLVAVLAAGVAVTFLLPSLYGKLGWHGAAENNSFFYYFPTNQLPSFAAGMLLHRWRDSATFNRAVQALALPALPLLIHCHGQPWGWMATPAVSAVFFMGLTSWCAGMRVPAWLGRTGECSFSVYLIHFFIVWNVCVAVLKKAPFLLGNEATALLLYAGISVASILISWQTYRRIELPMISLGRRVCQRRRGACPRDRVAPAN